MHIWICYGTFGGHKHPCSAAVSALRAAGHEPEVRKAFGAGVLPSALPVNWTSGRREAKAKTGDHHVPVLVLDDGTAIGGSKEIIAWAKANPASARAGS